MVRVKTGVQSVLDSELLASHRDGDPKAFALLVERHGAMVFRICRRFLPAQSHSSVDDAVETVFVILAQKSGELVHYTSLAGWLYRTAWFVTRNLRRSENNPVNDTVCLDTLEQKDPNALSPADLVSSAEIRTFLHAAIAMLPDRQRVAIMEHYFEAKTFDEIAIGQGISKASIKTHVLRGRARLKKTLERRGIVVVSTALAAVLEKEAEALSIGDLSVAPIGEGGLPIGGSGHIPERLQSAADAVMAEMDRAAAKTMWGKVGMLAVGFVTIVAVVTTLVTLNGHRRSADLTAKYGDAISKTTTDNHVVAPPNAARTQEGLICSYRFASSDGTRIPDEVGGEDPLTLTFRQLALPRIGDLRQTSEGLRFTQGISTTVSREGPSRLDALFVGKGFTAEAVLKLPARQLTSEEEDVAHIVWAPVNRKGMAHYGIELRLPPNGKAVGSDGWCHAVWVVMYDDVTLEKEVLTYVNGNLAGTTRGRSQRSAMTNSVTPTAGMVRLEIPGQLVSNPSLSREERDDGIVYSALRFHSDVKSEFWIRKRFGSVIADSSGSVAKFREGTSSGR